MKVFKFGGASVKDAAGVRNISTVLKQEGCDKTIVVISAMGKMTNAIEEVAKSYFNQTKEIAQNINFIKSYHENIIKDLFGDNSIATLNDVEQFYIEMSGFMMMNKSTNYNYIYDQIVSYGELISTKIVSNYLNDIGVENQWIDVRQFIKTDTNYRDPLVNWKTTQENISNNLSIEKLTITQGFLGSTEHGLTTTLGREGSDYTAAIFAYCLDAESVTIWKDVPGVLNADPRHFDETTLLKQISYTEAIEMAFYGASVIHPKTLKPLQNKNIPLFVRSFIDITKKGTSVSKGAVLDPFVPCFIVKKNQILISISALDFSFMVEYNISDIFKLLHEFQLKVNLIQNSAISFSVCVDDNFNNFEKFLEELKLKYLVSFDTDLTLYTVRHFDELALKKIENNREVLLKQLNKETVQIVVK
ncbi:MAG: aspartate kinase [Flavobacteriaceae bacterium]|nr:aspartate kinase [Flavobacteriaceae bacterium]